jgi:hypothetical protein
MARKSRIDAPGALHQIIFRGIERRSIFCRCPGLSKFSPTVGKPFNRFVNWFLCLGIDDKPRPLALEDRYGSYIHSDAAAADRICPAAQSKTQSLRGLVSEPVQIIFVQRGAVFAGTGSIHSFESGPCASCSGFKGFKIAPKVPSFIKLIT